MPKNLLLNMKKILFALTMLALVLPALPSARADVSIDFFYNNLSGGNWIEAGDYGYGWQPEVATSDPNWRPYADGYWAYTDVGWTWVSYEDFGWATYHYGRWANLADYGWVWFPGSDLEWGPAWVSWRTGGDYVGWAPLPPRGPGIVYAGGAIGGRVDIEFDIGPAYYNFIDARFIGEPVLRDRIFPYSQNVTYIDNTVNVTNITVQNNVVYNYGPDYNTLSSYSSRPIQRLRLERQQNADLSAAARTGALTKVQGDRLMVAAPQKINKAAVGVAPPKVKAKVAQPKINKGWAGVANEAQVKEKIKTENPKNIPPPTRPAAKGRAEASPGATAPAAAGGPVASPGTTEKGKGRGRPGRETQPGATVVPGAAQSPAAEEMPAEKGKRPGRPGAKPGMAGTPSGAPAEVAPGAPTKPAEKGKRHGKPDENGSFQGAQPEKEHGRPGRGRLETTPPPSGQTGAGLTAPEATKPPGKQKGRPERGLASPNPEQPPGGTANAPQQGRHMGRPQGQGAPPPTTFGQPGGQPSSGAAPYETRGGKQKGQGAYAQPGGGPPGGGQHGQGKPEGGQQKGQGTYAQPGGGPPGGGQPGQGKPEGGKKKGQASSPTPGPR
jgi:hypothetical protein